MNRRKPPSPLRIAPKGEGEGFVGQPSRRQRGRRSSPTTRPSAMRRMRSQRSASAMSWVIRMSVVPSARGSNRRSMTCLPVVPSRLPVGSSASSGLGRLTKARATATLLLAAGKLRGVVADAMADPRARRRLGELEGIGATGELERQRHVRAPSWSE